jgi:transposase InsO family protein
VTTGSQQVVAPVTAQADLDAAVDTAVDARLDSEIVGIKTQTFLPWSAVVLAVVTNLIISWRQNQQLDRVLDTLDMALRGRKHE